MSVCLTITKSIATISAGLNAGLCFGGIIEEMDSRATAGSSLREYVIGGLTSVATLLYTISYTGAPDHWKHPYLLYTGALGVVSLGATFVKFAHAVCAGKPPAQGSAEKCPFVNTRNSPTSSATSSDGDWRGDDDSMVFIPTHDSPHVSPEDAPASAPPASAPPASAPASSSVCPLRLLRVTTAVVMFVLGTIGALGEPLNQG